MHDYHMKPATAIVTWGLGFRSSGGNNMDILVKFYKIVENLFLYSHKYLKKVPSDTDF